MKEDDMDLHEVKVESAQAHGEGLTLLTLATGEWSQSHERPGQYLMFQAPSDDKARPMAIASAPGVSPLVLLFKAEGEREAALRALGPGDTVSCTAPAGPGYPVDKLGGELPGGALLLVATGTALAPIKACLDVLLDKGALPAATTLCVGARRKRELAFQSDLDRYREAGVDVNVIYSQPESGEGGHVQALLQDAPASPADTVVFSCGQPAMMDEVEAACEGHGVPRAQMFRNF
jgi:NAD(P)H-flavin reductase